MVRTASPSVACLGVGRNPKPSERYTDSLRICAFRTTRGGGIALERPPLGIVLLGLSTCLLNGERSIDVGWPARNSKMARRSRTRTGCLTGLPPRQRARTALCQTGPSPPPSKPDRRCNSLPSFRAGTPSPQTTTRGSSTRTRVRTSLSRVGGGGGLGARSRG